MSDQKQPENLYDERDVEALDEYYTRHVEAMTREGLHDKSAIAAELAWRDMLLEGGFSIRTHEGDRLVVHCVNHVMIGPHSRLVPYALARALVFACECQGIEAETVLRTIRKAGEGSTRIRVKDSDGA